MKKVDKKAAYVEFIFRGVSLTLLAVTLVSVLHPEIRTGIRKAFESSERIILSTASGNILHDGYKAKVLKIRENGSLFLEIYGQRESDESSSLIGKVPLDLKKDAYFTFKGVATNLALDDVDGDNKLEILVPGFDNNLTAQMDIYKFDEFQKVFYRVPSSQIPRQKNRAEIQ
ncbi:MAG: hypothetical protein KDD25_06830 [Bdellovibrionales bacterium]|nr:hypothetical protein [Bdellovibrionales bacterium]